MIICFDQLTNISFVLFIFLHSSRLCVSATVELVNLHTVSGGADRASVRSQMPFFGDLSREWTLPLSFTLASSPLLCSTSAICETTLWPRCRYVQLVFKYFVFPPLALFLHLYHWWGSSYFDWPSQHWSLSSLSSLWLGLVASLWFGALSKWLDCQWWCAMKTSVHQNTTSCGWGNSFDSLWFRN